MSILTLKKIIKTYGKGEATVHALNDIDLNINKGELIAIMGPSGCGKSTLLNILGCIDMPDSGLYILDGQEVNFKKLNKLSEVRNRNVSFVFQNFALIKEFSVINNVLLPLKFRKMSKKDKNEVISKYLKELDIWDIRNKRIDELSGGQQQRTAIARALSQETEIILADEPTGALDEENSKKIMEIFCSLNKKFKKTIIIVTHNPLVAEYCDRTLYMKDGRWI